MPCIPPGAGRSSENRQPRHRRLRPGRPSLRSGRRGQKELLPRTLRARSRPQGRLDQRRRRPLRVTSCLLETSLLATRRAASAQTSSGHQGLKLGTSSAGPGARSPRRMHALRPTDGRARASPISPMPSRTAGTSSRPARGRSSSEFRELNDLAAKAGRPPEVQRRRRGGPADAGRRHSARWRGPRSWASRASSTARRTTS